MIPFTCERVGQHGYAFSSLLEALQNLYRDQVASLPYESQVHVQSAYVSEDIDIGPFMGLIGQSLRKMVHQILGGDISEPFFPAQHHYVLFVFALIGVANKQAKWREGTFRILPQYWPLSHGQGHLQSIKVECKCGDVRKHALHKRTLTQRRTQELVARKRRGDVSGYRSGSTHD